MQEPRAEGQQDFLRLHLGSATGCVALGELPNLSVPQFLHLYEEDENSR